MITADGIKSVNERVKKIEVKGKNYVCVAARVAAFRELCPDGTIETAILAHADGVVLMQAAIKDENGKTLATGMAQEKESSSYINKTSYIENCETSAVGRALGMLGIGSDEGMASAEEVANAINNQDEPGKKKSKKPAEQGSVEKQWRKEAESEKASPEHIEALKDICKKHRISFSAYLANYKLTESTMTDADAVGMIQSVVKKYGD